MKKDSKIIVTPKCPVCGRLAIATGQVTRNIMNYECRRGCGHIFDIKEKRRRIKRKKRKRDFDIFKAITNFGKYMVGTTSMIGSFCLLFILFGIENDGSSIFINAIITLYNDLGGFGLITGIILFLSLFNVYTKLIYGELK